MSPGNSLKNPRNCSYVDPISHESCGKKILWSFGKTNVCWQHSQLWLKLVSLSAAAGILLTLFTFLFPIVNWIITIFSPLHYSFQPLFENKQFVDKAFSVQFELINTGKKRIEQLQIVLAKNDHFLRVPNGNSHFAGSILPDEKVNLSPWRLHPKKQGIFNIEIILTAKGIKSEILRYPIEVLSDYETPTTESIQSKINDLETELKQIDKTLYPLQFAQLSKQLGDLWLDLQTTPRDKNLYKAIEYYSTAEILFEKGDFNEKLASALMQKGLAYSSLGGGRSVKENKKSIELYNKALMNITNDSNPELYAKISLNVGNQYSRLSDFEPKNRNQYFQIALQNYKNSAEALPKEKYPYLNALVTLNIGAAHYRLGNIQDAINFFEESLNFFLDNKQKYAYQYAMIRNNLGEGYRRLPASSSVIRQKNLANAIDNLQEALTIYTLEHYPVQYARTQSNLGSVYNELRVGDLLENQRSSANAYLNALKVLNKEDYSYDFARIQGNLGNTYLTISDHFHSEQEKYLPKAIECYNTSIKTFKELNISSDNTWNSLGEAYRIKLDGNRHENLKRALDAYDKAIQEFLMYKPNQNDSKVLAMYKRNLSLAKKELTLLGLQ